MNKGLFSFYLVVEGRVKQGSNVVHRKWRTNQAVRHNLLISVLTNLQDNLGEFTQDAKQT